MAVYSGGQPKSVKCCPHLEAAVRPCDIGVLSLFCFLLILMIIVVIFVPSVSGIAMVSFSKTNQDQETLKVGSLWALAGALLYAIYLVMLKRRVDNEDSLDLPMFFGKCKI